MALSLSRKRDALAPAAEPTMIPFIDVLLVLLVIFMGTAPKPTTDLRVDAPPPGVSGAYSPIPPTIVVLRATQAGFAVFVGDELVSMDQLGPRTLAHILGANPDLTPQTAYSEARVFVRA